MGSWQMKSRLIFLALLYVYGDLNLVGPNAVFCLVRLADVAPQAVYEAHAQDARDM